jgi:hypothetical protein
MRRHSMSRAAAEGHTHAREHSTHVRMPRVNKGCACSLKPGLWNVSVKMTNRSCTSDRKYSL